MIKKGIILALALALLMPLALEAKHTKKISINYDNLWSGSIRFLRIERDLEITDRDKDAGYIIFVYKFDNRKKTSRATLEFITRGDEADGKKKVDMQLNIEDAPETMEMVFMDKLIEKLKSEYDVK